MEVCSDDIDLLSECIQNIEEEDFLLGWMNEAQCNMLQQYGTGPDSVVCIDSTHGTNSYNFHLTTLMVLDINRQGFPVAFLYSKKLTEPTFGLFFQGIKSRSGIIACNTFMSDMAPQF